MKNNTAQQEILLFTATTFASRQFSERNTNKENSYQLSQEEQIEKACWDGLLGEFLPMINQPAEPMYLWRIDSARTFLHLSLGPSPLCIEFRNSIDPYLFLAEANLN